MKKIKRNKHWFFIDEAGDPNFYSRKKYRGKRKFIVGENGCSKILLMGFVETDHAAKLRQQVRDFHQSLLERTPSNKLGKNTSKFLHATDDPTHVRLEFLHFIATLDCKAQFVVARKQETILLEEFDGRKSKFYDYLVSCLLDDKLHQHQTNNIFIARRGKPRLKQLVDAVELGKRRFSAKTNQQVATTYQVTVDHSYMEPCSWVIDYLNWTVYQAYTNTEMRYFEIIRDKVSFLQDIYDENNRVGNKHLYDRKNNPFDINKTTPL